MPNCKEGEGLCYISPDVFETTALVKGTRYTVILLGDGDVVVRGYATVGKSEFDEDFRIHLADDNQRAFVSMKLPVFSTRYIHNFDIIIRDEERTLIMLPNVGAPRG
jgi:hypothetical protein